MVASRQKKESKDLDPIDHIAISVKDVKAAVEWYTQTFVCEVDYQDETWAFLSFNNIKLALVIPEQHPPHIAFVTPNAESFGQLKKHRDGTESVYVNDPSGNSVEVMAPYPADPKGGGR
jgi:catechol 2,3-dioxygenase-like lactoylglutathione lyase family enzyme